MGTVQCPRLALKCAIRNLAPRGMQWLDQRMHRSRMEGRALTYVGRVLNDAEKVRMTFAVIEDNYSTTASLTVSQETGIHSVLINDFDTSDNSTE